MLRANSSHTHTHTQLSESDGKKRRQLRSNVVVPSTTEIEISASARIRSLRLSATSLQISINERRRVSTEFASESNQSVISQRCQRDVSFKRRSSRDAIGTRSCPYPQVAKNPSV